MEKTQDKTRQVESSTVCRVKVEIVDKESGKVESAEFLETPLMLLVARDSKSKTGYYVRGLLNCDRDEGYAFIKVCGEVVANTAATIFAPDVKKIAKEMKKEMEKRREGEPFPEFVGLGGDDNT